MKLTLRRLSTLQIEVTARYPLDKSKKRMAHTVDTYLFVPKRLGINADAYPQYLFYRDLQTYSELLARPQCLSDILSPINGLLSQLKQNIDKFRNTADAADMQAFENKNRAFCHIVHDAIDSQLQQIVSSLDSPMESHESADCALAVEEYLDLTRQLREEFREIETDLAQDYLKTEGQRFFYDFRNTLYGQTTSHPLGVQRESFSFVSTKKLPADVVRLRKRSHLKAFNTDYGGERTILYKRHSKLYPARLVDAFTGSEVEGICQILHFDFSRFARKMENRKSSVFTPHDGAYRREDSRRVYHLHLVIKYQAGATHSYQHYRIVMTRGGILRIDDLADTPGRPGASLA